MLEDFFLCLAAFFDILPGEVAPTRKEKNVPLLPAKHMVAGHQKCTVLQRQVQSERVVFDERAPVALFALLIDRE